MAIIIIIRNPKSLKTIHLALFDGENANLIADLTYLLKST